MDLDLDFSRLGLGLGLGLGLELGVELVERGFIVCAYVCTPVCRY